MKKITNIVPVILGMLLIIACNKNTTPPANNQSSTSNCYNKSPLFLDILWCVNDSRYDSVLIKFSSDGTLFSDYDIQTWVPVETNCDNVIVTGNGRSVVATITNLTSDSMELKDKYGSFIAHKIEIIGNPIKIGSIEVAQFDMPKRKSSIPKNIEILGEGWRLPSVSELNTMYLNKNKIGNFKNYYYLTNENAKLNGVDYEIKQNLSNGNKDTARINDPFVRAVRSL